MTSMDRSRAQLLPSCSSAYGGGGGSISCCSASFPVSTTEPQESSEAEPSSSPGSRNGRPQGW